MWAIIIEVEAAPSEAYWRARGSRLVCGGDDEEEGRPGLRTPECPRAGLAEGHRKHGQQTHRHSIL